MKHQHGNRKRIEITEYTPNGRVKRTARLSETGDILVESQPRYDRHGRNFGTVQKQRKRHVTGQKTPEFETISRFTKQWNDPAGRVIATADYGFIDTDSEPVQEFIPQSSETVRITQTLYCPKTGRVLTSIGPDGLQTRTIVDAAGRTLKTIANFTGNGIYDPQKPDENITTEIRYDIVGNLIWQKDPLGNITQKEYDKLGRLIVSIAPNGGRTNYEYNTSGEMISVTDPMGRTMRFEYDSMGRRVKTILPKLSPEQDNPVEEIVYNEVGQIVAQIDPLGNTTRFEYNELGQKIKQIDANGGVTSFDYDEEGKLLSLTDPVGNTTRYEYDEFDRVIKETNELGKSRFFEYSPAGQLSEKTDRNRRTIRFQYNRFGQKTAELWQNGRKTVKKIEIEYDLIGRMIGAGDETSTFKYETNTLGRIVSEKISLNGLKSDIMFENTFDVMNRHVAQTATVGRDEVYTTHCTYNPIGQTATILQDDNLIKYSYNLSGQRAGVEVNGVYQSSLTYDGAGHLAEIHYQNPADKTLAKYGLTWNNAGQIVAANIDGEHAQYSYDNTNQLTDATYDKLPAEHYEYDLNGNRKNFETGKNNQLTSDGEFRYTYDDEGNRISKTSLTSGEKTVYNWDYRNRLVEVTIGSGRKKQQVQYRYDYLNRLTHRNNELFVHSGWQIMFTLDAKSNIQNRYLWGARQDELLCENGNFVLCDHSGTVRDILDSKGKNITMLKYNAFGKLIFDNKDLPRFRYTGKMTDDITNLQWNINRWYDANLERWISEDPIGFIASDNNLHRYGKNMPIIIKDTQGLLSDNDAERIINKWHNVVGSEYFCPEGYIRKLLNDETVMYPGINGIGVDAILLGIPLPDSLVGKITVATLKRMLDEALSEDPSTIQEIIQEIAEEVGGDVTVL